jgi:hypothetical protein
MVCRHLTKTEARRIAVNIARVPEHSSGDGADDQHREAPDAGLAQNGLRVIHLFAPNA